jgi:hypothetical protein
MLTLEALASDEAGSSESSTGSCRTSMTGSSIIAWRCDCQYDAPKHIVQTTYVCTGNDGGSCRPGTILIAMAMS